MMHLAIFLKGFVAGLLVCAPFGPVGVLALKHTLAKGKAAGVAAILGGSLVDIVYCSLAGFSITFLAEYLEAEHIWIQAFAGLILIGYGLRMFSGHASEMPVPDDEAIQVTPEDAGVRPAFWSAFLLMAVNPMPILVFTVTFSAVGVHGWKGDYLSTAVLVSGVAVGSAIWAPVVVSAVRYFGTDFSRERRMQVSRISGLLLSLFGLLLGLSSLF